MKERSSLFRLAVTVLLLVVFMLPENVTVYAAQGEKVESACNEEEFIQIIYDNLLHKKGTFTVAYEGNWEDVYHNNLDGLFERVYEIDDKETTDDFDYMKGNIKKYGLKLSSNGIHSEFTFNVEYRESKAQTAKVNSMVKSTLKSLKLTKSSDYTKVKKIHDYIVNRVSYDTNYKKYTAYDAINKKKSVCQGYALLFYKMASEAGVPCRVVTSSSHAWNIVKLGGKWYHIDTTWDDPVSCKPVLRYDYFLKGSDSVEKTHILSSEYRTKTFREAYSISEADYKK